MVFLYIWYQGIDVKIDHYHDCHHCDCYRGQAADLHALMTAKPGQFSHYHHQLSSLQHSQAQHQQAAMAAAFGTITSYI